MEATIIIGMIHALALLAITSRSVSRLTADWQARLSAGFLLVWGNLVYTGMVLAVFSKLDHRALYFSVSIAAAIGVEALLQYRRVVAPPAASEALDVDKGGFPRFLRMTLGGTLILAAIGSAAICVAYVPNNWDTCTYRFSRAFFYLAKGNLLHIGVTDDPRLLFYPLNGTLLYLFLATYGFAAKWMSLVTYLSWIYAGVGTYFVARCLRATVRGSLVAAWVCMLTPSVLAQATSTNDEVLAAVPILIALGFALRWFSAGLLRDAILAGIGLGLGCGSKLHWTFNLFVVLVAMAVIVVRALYSRQFRATLAARIPAMGIAAALALPMILNFVVCSYISSGRLTDEEYNNAILNRPFRASLAREKIRINTAELFLSPIPDLIPPVDRERRTAAYREFNQYFMRGWFRDLVEVTRRSPEGYIFEGPANPDGAAPTEYTVWLGFTPHLLLLVCVVGLITRRLPWPAVAIAASFFVWHTTYSTQNRYIPTASVYYSFPAVLAFASLGPIWDWARRSRRWVKRAVTAVFLTVIGANAVLAANLLAFGGLRNLQFVWKNAAPAEMHAVDAGVSNALREAQRIYIPYTYWEVLYWNFMRFHPSAAYTTGTDLRLPSRDTMMVLSCAREGAVDLVPAKLPAGTVPGLSYLGVADGRPIFAQGGGVEARIGSRNGYLLLPVTWTMNEAGRMTGLKPGFGRPSQNVPCCVGIGDKDGIEYRYELRSNTGGGVLSGAWCKAGGPDPGLAAIGTGDYDLFIIETRGAARRDLVVRTVHSLSAQRYEVRE